MINLAVGDYLKDVHEKVNKIRLLLAAMKFSVKQRDIYEKLEKNGKDSEFALIGCFDALFDYVYNTTKCIQS